MRAIILTCLVLAVASDASARISAAEDTGSLFKKASVILKGEVVSVKDAPALPADPSDLAAQNAGRMKAKARVAEFRVDRVIRGDISAKTVDIVFYESSGKSANVEPINLKPGEYLIVFVKQRGSVLTFMDLDHGKMRAQKSSGKAGKVEARAAMREELLQLVRSSDSEVSEQGIQALGEMGDKEALVPELRKLKSGPNAKLRKKSLRWLARSGDKDSVKELVNDIKADKGAAGHHDNLEAIEAIGNGKDLESAPDVAELLTHSDPFVRRKSMESLRKLKNRKTLAKIAAALDDSDKDVQYDAVMAMCEMSSAKPQGCPSTILFKANPDKYTSEWKVWWASHKDTGR